MSEHSQRGKPVPGRMFCFPQFLTALFLLHPFPKQQCLLTLLLTASSVFSSVRWDVVLHACAKLDAKSEL